MAMNSTHAALSRLETEAKSIASPLSLNLDILAYQAAQRDPLEPLLCGGNAAAELGFFGRDPGRDELKHWQPLVGAAGRRVRAAVHSHFHPENPQATAEELLRSGDAFYSNTVPYKQVGNKAWGEAMIRRFIPVISSVLVDTWKGSTLIPLGTEAFKWFALGADEAQAETLEKFWASPDRYTREIAVRVKSSKTGQTKKIILMPLPHPSPLNVAWFKKFPALLEGRLKRVDK